ncbi:MAG: acyl-CoA reductase [Elusimicrobiaceae bacterium]|nr:acyl-CoA reductase [Elusimicrobiaceae bacterium]
MKIPASCIFGKPFSGALAPDKVAAVLKTARLLAPAAAAVPPAYIIDVLVRAGALFGAKNGAWRAAAREHLKETIPFSEPMTELTLDIIPHMLARGELERRLALELVVPPDPDGFAARPGYDGVIKVVPKGVVLHVGAGNVFLGVVDSLVLGILTRNVNIVKTSSSGSNFAALFVKALAACDKKNMLVPNIAVLNWKGGSEAIERAAVSGSDAVFVWGGAEAVNHYRRLAPETVAVTGFGPKVSFGLAMPSALDLDARAVARAAVRDAGLWDQSACACAHELYLVCPRKAKRAKLLAAMTELCAEEFAALERGLPQGRMSDDEKVETLRARELAKVDAAAGRAELRSGFPRHGWTVIAETDSAFKISPLNRVLYVKCAGSLEEIGRMIAPYRGYVQTAGIAGNFREKKEAASVFAPLGVARITDLGKMLQSPAGSPHDGRFPMSELVSFAGVEGGQTKLDRFAELISYARRKSPFYRDFYKGLKTEIRTLEEFAQLPFLTKEHILANTPPDSYAMFTGPIEKGIYFASGGSTGSPKYIFYDAAEFERVSMHMGRSLERAGLGAGDRAANLFVAGNLWSSFLSVEKALPYTDAVSVPIGSALPMESILKYLAEFDVTAIIGLPSFLLKVAEAAADHKVKSPLRYIFYGGEYVGPEMAAYFRTVFPGVRIHSAAYATVDAGVIGYQCPHCSGGMHHLFADEHYLEIVDPETGAPVAPGQTGELVTTVLNKRHMPIIRFRLGDLGRLVESPCPCGSRDRRFEILGRCDDRVHVGGAHLFVGDMAAAVSAVSGLSFNFQAVISNSGPREMITFRAETAEPVMSGSLRRRLAAQLLDAIRSHCEDLTYVLDRRWMADPVIEILPPGGIERVARTGKIKRVIDLRINN